MKTLFIFLIGISLSGSLCSQTLAEWTQQKKTQQKYLLQQIEAFRIYLGYAKKGYDIVQKGLATVQNIKDGEWNLHKDFFEALSIVNPSVKKYAKVSDIIATQVKMTKQLAILNNLVKQNKSLTPDEIEYVVKITTQLFTRCIEHLDELILVISSGHLEMKDDERIRRLDNIYAKIEEDAIFLRSFGNSITMLSGQRLHENREIELSQKFYHLK